MGKVGMGMNKIREKVYRFMERDEKNQPTSQISGSSYGNVHGTLESQVVDIAKDFLYVNPMHFELFPGAR